MDLFQILKSPRKSARSIVIIDSSVSCLHCCRTCLVVGLLEISSRLQLPLRTVSANGESAAQFRSLRRPVVNGVPAHWLKCDLLRASIAVSKVLWSYSVSVVPLVDVLCTKVTPGFGGWSIHLSFL